MSLRHALIALLTGQPMTGYELSRQFGASVGHVWHAPNSQIYPELRKLEAEGLLEGTPVPWGTGGKTKTSYTVTTAGLDDFRNWMRTPLQPIPTRDPEYLRTAYLEYTTPAGAREILRTIHEFHSERRDVLTATRATLLDHSHPTLAARLSHLDEGDWDRIIAIRAYAYDGMIAREQAQVDWAKDGFALVDRLAKDDENWH